jgi:hypothetical protein
LVEFVAHHRDNGQTDKQIRNKVLTAAWAEEPVPPKGTDDGPPRKESIATRLVRIAQEALDLFHTPDGQGYGRTKVAPHQVWALRSRPARQHLAQLFYKAEHIAPAAEAMSTALSTLEGIAVHDGQEHPVFTRMGHAPDGAIYLDLGDPTWRAVAVRRDGWQIVADCPVMFRRSRGLLALPEPVRGGSVHQLRELYNVGSDNDWQLIVGWMLGAFRPKGPYPVLVLAGEQGSAKSSAAELARDTIDPNTASLRSEPRDPRDLMIAATNSWVIAYDNLSHLPPWLSDCLCRLATGGGFATRELYSDGDETIFSATRPALVNGIEDIVTRADLLDRSMLVSLPTIPEHARRTKSSIDGAFKAMHAQVLGALLDAVCTGLTNIDKVKLRNLPRMADFARWVTACSSALGWEKTAFVDAYRENIRAANDLALGESAIVGPLRKLIERHTTWSGTPGDLLVALTKLVDEKLASSRDWPKRPNELGGRLKRLAPNLRKAGVHIDFKRSGLARLIELSEYKLPQRSATPAPK